jgi:hypothetical protein
MYKTIIIITNILNHPLDMVFCVVTRLSDTHFAKIVDRQPWPLDSICLPTYTGLARPTIRVLLHIRSYERP